jgi:hypothetical protein
MTRKAIPIANSDLQYVILDCPRRSWHTPETRRLFEKILSLKLAGYGTMYSERLIPFDKSDFYGTHIAICRQYAAELVPLAAMKTVTLSRCEEFHDEFTWLAVLKRAKPETYQRTKRICEDIRARGEDAIYGGTWTSDPTLRTDRALAIALKEMIFAYMMHATWAAKNRVWMCFGALTAKTEKYFAQMGMTAMSEVFPLHPEQDVIAFLSESYTKDALELAERHRAAFENRIFLGEVKDAKAA